MTAKTAKGPDMRVNLAGVELQSPVIAASGTFGYGVEFEEIVSLNRIGAFVTKGLSREPMAGNPTPRIVETAAGMMNAIGLQNMGARAFAEEKMPKLRSIPGAVVGALTPLGARSAEGARMELSFSEAVWPAALSPLETAS